MLELGCREWSASDLRDVHQVDEWAGISFHRDMWGRWLFVGRWSPVNRYRARCIYGLPDLARMHSWGGKLRWTSVSPAQAKGMRLGGRDVTIHKVHPRTTTSGHLVS